jgi:hypothetical protein
LAKSDCPKTALPCPALPTAVLKGRLHCPALPTRFSGQVPTPAATTPKAAVAASPPASNVKFADEVGLVVDDGGAGGRRPFQDDPEWYLTQLVNALPASKG